MSFFAFASEFSDSDSVIVIVDLSSFADAFGMMICVPVLGLVVSLVLSSLSESDSRFSSNCILQKGSNMGEKIWYLVKNKKKSFILIGSDIPGINQNIISKAFYNLKNHDMVIGPTEDGGFWLIGFSNKKNLSYPFKGIRWSSSNTFKDLITNLDNINISYKITTKLRDIDNKDDYCKNIHGLEINL